MNTELDQGQRLSVAHCLYFKIENLHRATNVNLRDPDWTIKMTVAKHFNCRQFPRLCQVVAQLSCSVEPSRTQSLDRGISGTEVISK